jgi:hypothetical protein
MAAPAYELQKALFTALTSNAPLLALLGGPKVYDDVPRQAALPYVTFGQSTLRDWSTGTEAGFEHLLTLHVWSQVHGDREAHQIMAAIRDCLHDVPLSVAAHTLINLRFEFSDLIRDADGETAHGIVRYRAVLEPA